MNRHDKTETGPFGEAENKLVTNEEREWGWGRGLMKGLRGTDYWAEREDTKIWLTAQGIQPTCYNSFIW